MREAPQEFHHFYREMWGARWESLFGALSSAELQVARKNRFCAVSGEVLSVMDVSSTSTPTRNELGLLDSYIMDPASILVAFALGVRPGMKVLDLCAAPGGKTLILAEGIFLESDGKWIEQIGKLIANEPSADRRTRLTKVIRQYIPEKVRQSVWVTGRDGVSFGRKPEPSFDRILVDAPCSGERHLLENVQALKEWSPRRSEGLMKRQYGLLTAAFENLAPGGRIVYSTCSLSHLENEEVLRKFFAKRGERAQLVKENLLREAQVLSLTDAVEEWEFGFQVLPDRGGAGPLRWAVIEKK